MDPFRMVREMFQDPFGGLSALAETAFRPNLDVAETNDAFDIRVDLPGVEEEDVEVAVTGNRLTLSGRRDAEEMREGDRYVAIERAYGAFSRSFVLPDSADLDHVEAQLRDGVLMIKVPKRSEMKGRKVSIQGTSRSPELEQHTEKAQQHAGKVEQQPGMKEVQIQEEAAAKKAA
jgi:HSP20 family protein